MKKYEYKTVDLTPTWTLNNDKKQAEMIDRLNELGKDGWIAVSGFEIVKYTVFIRKFLNRTINIIKLMLQVSEYHLYYVV